MGGVITFTFGNRQPADERNSASSHDKSEIKTGKPGRRSLVFAGCTRIVSQNSYGKHSSNKSFSVVQVLNLLPQYMFNFARKPLLQQLPTAYNLFRWKKIDSPNCCLCKSSEWQSNKHVLSHCSAKIALERYTSRHDNTLNILAAWLKSVKQSDTLFADISSDGYSRNDQVFEPVCRPDLVLVKRSKVNVIELTVCHESKLLKSKLYKTNKYQDIKNHIKSEYSNCTVELFTIEISVSGFVADLSEFCESLGIINIPKYVLSSIIRSALVNSQDI